MQRYQDSIILSTGQAVQGAAVQVLTYPVGAVATIYSDNSGTVTTNPLITDANGHFAFYAADARYSLSITKVGIAPITISDILLEDPADGSAALSASGGAALVGFLPFGIGGVAGTVQGELRRIVWLEQFGFSTTASASANVTAITNAMTSIGNTGTLMFGLGTFNIGDVGLPDVNGLQIYGRSRTGSVLNYIGSGSAIAKTNQTTNKGYHIFKSFKIVNSGTGTRGIDLSALWLSALEDVFIDSFTNNIYMERGTTGCYSNSVRRCETNAGSRGIWLSATGSANQCNQHHIKENRFYKPTIAGIQGDATNVLGCSIEDNDIESTGALTRFIDWQGGKSRICGNWMDSANAGNTGLYLRGSKNSARENIYAGTFGTPYDVDTTLNEFLEPDRSLSTSSIPWQFKSSATSYSTTVSVPNNTATTVYTLVDDPGIGLFMVWLDSNPQFYGVAFIGLASTNPVMSTIVSANLTLSRSGSLIQVTHTIGTTQTFRYSFLKLY